MLFISHDLAVVRQAADRIYVLYQGRLVEEGDAAAVLDHPQNDYTPPADGERAGRRGGSAMTGTADSVSPRLEQVPLLGETRAELIGLGLPAPVADSWARHVHPLLRTVLVLRGRDGLLGAAFVVRRALGRYVKLVGVWVCEAADAETVRASLLDELERFAWSSGAVVIKHELADPGALDALLATQPGRGSGARGGSDDGRPDSGRDRSRARSRLPLAPASRGDFRPRMCARRQTSRVGRRPS